jgi:hypothetical protein
MRQHDSPKRSRLVAALLVASVAVFALAGSIHRHDVGGPATGATLAAGSGELRQATPCLACLVAHSVSATPVVLATTATPQIPLAFLPSAQDRPVSIPTGTSRAGRAPPATSTTLVPA